MELNQVYTLKSSLLYFAAINNNTVDILTEWREELADEQNINALLKLSKDLLDSESSQPLGPDELSYRQEQALYWLCKVNRDAGGWMGGLPGLANYYLTLFQPRRAG